MSRDELDLGADEIVGAAVEILREQGLDAVSMRRVSARLGVSPVPVYSRVGNKQALVQAMADHLLADLAAPVVEGEHWTAYAARWAQHLRARLHEAHDSRLILVTERVSYVEASRPLVAALRAAGFDADAAVQACRLVMWATVGFVAVESAGPKPSGRRRPRTRSGGDPAGVRPGEADVLFAMQLRHLIDGIARDGAGREGGMGSGATGGRAAGGRAAGGRAAGGRAAGGRAAGGRAADGVPDDGAAHDRAGDSRAADGRAARGRAVEDGESRDRGVTR